jgi:NitT/TauT family transport system permease protein
VVPVLLVLLWEVATRAGFGDYLYTPRASAVVVAWFQMLLSGELFFHAGASLSRMAIGFPIAVAIGLPMGLVLGRYRPLERWVTPLFEFLRPLPGITLVPLVVLLFGIGLKSKVMLVAYSCFWPLLLNSLAGVRDLDPIYLKVARVFEIRGLPLFWKVILPGAMPHILDGVRLGLSISVVVLMVSEMMGATGGLGFLILESERNFDTAKMLAAIATMGMLGFVLNEFANVLERALLGKRGRIAR